MKRKILSTLLAAAMTATLLAGCTGGTTTTTEQPTETETKTEDTTETETKTEDTTEVVEETAEPSGDVVELNLWTIDYNGQSTDQAVVAQVQDAMNARLEELGSNARITLTTKVEGEYFDSANLALPAGEVDILWCASWAPTISSTALYNNGYVYDITDLLPGTRLYESMPEWFWTVAQYGGRDYFVPVYKEGAEGYMIKVLTSTADAIGGVDNAAIEAEPDTYSRLKALEPYLQKAKDQGVKYPFVFAGTPMFYRFYMDKYDFIDGGAMAMLGVDQATDEMVNPIQTEDYLNYCTMMAEWGEKGYIAVDDEIGGQVDASTTQTSDWLFNWWTRVPNNDESIGRDGNQDETFIPVTESWGKSLSSIGSCFAVSSTCTEEEAKAAVDFLGWLETDNTLADLYTFGIEGVSYNLVDGKIDRTADGMQSGSSCYYRSPWCSTSVQALTLEQGEPDDKVALYVDFNNAAKATTSAGFVFDRAPVDTQFTACVDVFNEYGKTLELGGYGTADVADKIDEFQAALDAAGYQDVLAEAQSQYNAWKASK